MLKWPTILLALFLASLLTGVRRVCRAPGDLLVMCAFAVVFLFFAIQSKYDIGERHILPLYPFVAADRRLVLGARQSAQSRIAIQLRMASRTRVINFNIVALLLVLALNAADALRCAPDYLTYFNILVKPANSWRYLTDSNLDWGQGLIALREYEFQHPGETLRLAYFGSVNPALYGVRAMPLAPEEHVTGKVVIGASCLVRTGADRSQQLSLAAVLSAERDDRPLDVRVRDQVMSRGAPGSRPFVRLYR